MSNQCYVLGWKTQNRRKYPCDSFRETESHMYTHLNKEQSFTSIHSQARHSFIGSERGQRAGGWKATKSTPHNAKWHHWKYFKFNSDNKWSLCLLRVQTLQHQQPQNYNTFYAEARGHFKEMYIVIYMYIDYREKMIQSFFTDFRQYYSFEIYNCLNKNQCEISTMHSCNWHCMSRQ